MRIGTLALAIMYFQRSVMSKSASTEAERSKLRKKADFFLAAAEKFNAAERLL